MTKMDQKMKLLEEEIFYDMCEEIPDDSEDVKNIK